MVTAILQGSWQVWPYIQRIIKLEQSKEDISDLQMCPELLAALIGTGELSVPFLNVFNDIVTMMLEETPESS